MSDDREDDDAPLDWRLVKEASRERQQPGGSSSSAGCASSRVRAHAREAGGRLGGDRDDRADRGKRRSPPAAKPAPQAKMIAFPGARRVGEIRRLAEQMRRLPYERGEAHLRQQLRNKAEALRRRGLTERQITREIASMEAAVRGEHWRREFGSSR